MIHIGDCLEVLRTIESGSVQTCVTSPPYWGLRDYGVEGQLGLEKTPDEYVAKMVDVFREVRRVLREDGTLWLNLGDSYAGNRPVSQVQTESDIRHAKVGNALQKVQRRIGTVSNLKPKDLVGIPWRVAFALQADGWYLRQDIIWHKPNPMPESVTDRCTKSHEYIFLFSKSQRYYFDNIAIREEAVASSMAEMGGGPQKLPVGSNANAGRSYAGSENCAGSFTRNRRSVWKIATQPFKGAHFATFPPKLIEPCVLAGSKQGDTVLDPFNGAGTTGLVAHRNGREYVGIELNPEYAAIAEARIRAELDKTALLECIK